MGWSLGYDNNWQRDVGYGVPAPCDFPKCEKEIDRGLSYVCGSDMFGGDYGCGLYFCQKHFRDRKPHGSDVNIQLCPRCYRYRSPYEPKPDNPRWVKHKLTHPSWKKWRENNPEEVEKLT